MRKVNEPTNQEISIIRDESPGVDLPGHNHDRKSGDRAIPHVESIISVC